VRTVPALWEEAAGGSHRVPFLVADEAGAWRPVPWPEARAAVEELAAGFLAAGVAPGGRVAIVGRTRLEWTLCDYALASLGAVTVPVYPTSSVRQTEHVLRDSGARYAVCEDAEQYAKVASLRAALPGLEHVVCMDAGRGSARSLADLRADGAALLAREPGAVAARRESVGEDDLLTIIYTSGTTGEPKGCLIAHRHYWTMVDMVRRVPGLFVDGDVVLLYLPLAHTFARLVAYLGAGAGFTVAFCPDAAQVPEALRAVRPTIFPSVPRAFEKAHAHVRATVAEAHGPRRRLLEWALVTGDRAARRRRAGRRLGPGLAGAHALAERLVLRSVRRRIFGDRLRVAVSGGAPLDPAVGAFFAAIGVPILEGYGLTECTTASHLNEPGRLRLGTVGTPLAGVEARIAGDGEVLLRSPAVFLGYHGDPEATAAVLGDDGWLRTGDLGEIDGDGYLTVTGRKKEIIITAGGKNLSPQAIERALCTSPYVADALVVGDRRPYVAALLVPEEAELARAAATPAERHALLERAVAEVNRDLGRPEQIKRFAVLERAFDAALDEVTPTLKLRRHVCEEHFRAEIDALYAGTTAEAG
jgi:long-chain acyl-CoA synthetase